MKAHKWINIANAATGEHKDMISELSGWMTPEQISKAQGLARAKFAEIQRRIEQNKD